MQGCQYREHTVQILNDRDRAILKLAQVAAEGNCLYEPAPNKLLKASVLNDLWWNGIILTPSKDRPGLLPPIVLAGNTNTISLSRQSSVFLFFCILENRGGRVCGTKVCIQSSASIDSSSDSESSNNFKSNKLLNQFSTTSSDGCESDYSSPRPLKPRVRQAQR